MSLSSINKNITLVTNLYEKISFFSAKTKRRR